MLIKRDLYNLLKESYRLANNSEEGLRHAILGLDYLSFNINLVGSAWDMVHHIKEIEFNLSGEVSKSIRLYVSLGYFNREGYSKSMSIANYTSIKIIDLNRLGIPVHDKTKLSCVDLYYKVIVKEENEGDDYFYLDGRSHDGIDYVSFDIDVYGGNHYFSKNTVYGEGITIDKALKFRQCDLYCDRPFLMYKDYLKVKNEYQVNIRSADFALGIVACTEEGKQQILGLYNHESSFGFPRIQFILLENTMFEFYDWLNEVITELLSKGDIWPLPLNKYVWITTEYLDIAKRFKIYGKDVFFSCIAIQYMKVRHIDDCFELIMGLPWHNQE